VEHVRARREVLLCGGTVASPQNGPVDGSVPLQSGLHTEHVALLYGHAAPLLTPSSQASSGVFVTPSPQNGPPGETGPLHVELQRVQSGWP